MEYFIKYKRAGTIITGNCSILREDSYFIIIKINNDINKVRRIDIYELKLLKS